MIDVEEGAEYKGERYIRCTSHSPYEVFEGRSVCELVDFLAEHDHDHEIWGQLDESEDDPFGITYAKSRGWDRPHALGPGQAPT